jgi:nucleotide-binding universal stress UspA family protein
MTAVEPTGEAKSFLMLKTILVAVDLSSHSEKTAACAAAIARRFGASVKLIHVYVPPASTELGAQNISSTLESDRETAERQLIGLADKIRAKYGKCDHHLQIGDPAEQIAKTARIVGADLIVTACHHQTFLGHLLNLEQAPRIIHRASCPVLVWQDNED